LSAFFLLFGIGTPSFVLVNAEVSFEGVEL
jgi:hypothetical protein